MKNIYYTLIIMVIVFISCIEEYNPNVGEYDNTLIVQGMITNQEGPYDIYLKRTVSLSSKNNFNFVEDAHVMISDSEGNEEVLEEISPGHYQTDTNGIAGVIGRTYILNIITVDGNIYESDPVILKDVPEIDTVYASYRETYSFEDQKYLKGIDIVVESEEWNDKTDYILRWDYKEIWQSKTKWTAIENGEFTDSCWNINYSSNTIIDRTTAYTIKKAKKNITYLSEKNPKPFHNYKIKINQYSINETTYYFWKMIQESSDNNGNIYDNIPYSPISNLNCINDENTKILGYFDACGISSKIAVFKSPILNIDFYDFNSICESTTISADDYTPKYYGWTYIINISPGFRNITFTDQKYCVDCMQYSDSEQEPLL
jgi:hypothetical protein